jgi:hypothetical protein
MLFGNYFFCSVCVNKQKTSMSGLVHVTYSNTVTVLKYKTDAAAAEAARLHGRLPAALRVKSVRGKYLDCEPSTNVVTCVLGAARNKSMYALVACMLAVRGALAANAEHHGDFKMSNVQLVNRSSGRIKVRLTGFVPRAVGGDHQALVAADSAMLLTVLQQMYSEYRRMGGASDKRVEAVLQSGMVNPTEFARGAWPELDDLEGELGREEKADRGKLLFVFGNT